MESKLALLLGSAILSATAYWLSIDARPGTDPTEPPAAPEQLRLHGTEAMTPLPETTGQPNAKVELGERLFRDKRLSRNDSVACLSCHDLTRGGADGRRFSIGIDGRKGPVNAPTVFNATFNFAQFWDGRAATLEEQVAGPIHNPLEMDSNWAEVLGKLKIDRDYPDQFSTIYPDGLTANTIADAIASFERTLITPHSRFDRYLQGQHDALTIDELEGYRRFKELGCASCHQGKQIGGNLFQKFGIVRDYFADRPITKADLGRFNVTGQEQDRHIFKVPSLRNIAVTAPYFHDGSAETLEEAVSIMGLYQLGRELSPEDTRLITSFLQTLTGEWQGKPLH